MSRPDILAKADSHTPLQHPHGLAEKAQRYAERSKAPSTLARYDVAWRGFLRWCGDRTLVPLPADPRTIADYLADEADRLRPVTLGIHLAAISEAHRLVGMRNPVADPAVRAVMSGIRRTHGVAAKQKAPLLVGDVTLIATSRAHDLQGLRDRALILVGFCGALRRSEIVGLDVDDLSFQTKGLALHLRRGKTDQEARGRAIGIGYGGTPVTCPVVSIREWLTAAGVDHGPVFRAVDRHGRVGTRRMALRSVGDVVKRLGSEIGIDPQTLAGHSLRAGFATSAAAAGVSEREIALVTGHRSLLVLRGYIRSGTLFDGDVVRRLGL